MFLNQDERAEEREVPPSRYQIQTTEISRVSNSEDDSKSIFAQSSFQFDNHSTRSNVKKHCEGGTRRDKDIFNKSYLYKER